MLNRRQFIAVLGTVTAGQALTPLALGRRRSGVFDSTFEVKGLPGGAYAIGGLSDGGLVVALPTDEGPILIDAKFSHTAPDLLDTAKALAEAPPTLLINTHHHGDHTGGNWIFKPRARIVAHKNLNPRIPGNLPRYQSGARQVMQAVRGEETTEAQVKAATELAERIESLTAEQFTAAQTFEDTLTLKHGGVTVELLHFGPGHTDNDTVIVLPEQNIMHAGDLLFHDLHPYIDRGAGADTKAWQKALGKAMERCNDKTTVVAGHGGVTDRAALAGQIAYFDTLRAIVDAAIAEGRSREEIIAMRPEEFQGRGFERLQSQALGAVYDEQKGVPAES